MADKTRKTLPKDPTGMHPVLPDQIPDDPNDLLDLMDEAATHAARGRGPGAPTYDRGVLLFNQLHAHFQTRIVHRLGEEHAGLTSATKALKVATWWLAIVTFILGAFEGYKLVCGH